MSLPKITDDLNVVSKLATKPNVTDGMSASALKSKFDEAGGRIKTYLNTVLTVQLDTIISNIQQTLLLHHTRHEHGGLDEITVSRDMISDSAINEDKIDGNAVTASKILAGAVSADYTATLSAASWSGSAAPFSYACSISGILATDKPLVDLVASGTWATAEKQIEAWGYVYRCVTSANTLTFYATEKPEVNLPVKILCVRK